MSRKQLILLITASALGYFVDAYDLLIFSVVRQHSLTDLGVGSAASLQVGLSLLNYQMVGLILGGILLGSLGDKKGRLAVLFVSIGLYSVANILNAFVVGLALYKALRFVAGVGLAGELGAGISIVSEVLSPKRRGIGTMIVATFGLLGAAVAALVGTSLSWRVSFFVGGVMGLALLVMRIGLVESGIYTNIKRQAISKGNFFALFSSFGRTVSYLRCIGVGLSTYFVVGLLITGAPEFGKTLGLSVAPIAGTAVLICYLSMSCGDICCTALSQYSRSRRLPLAVFNCIVLFGTLIFVYLPPRTIGGFYWRCALVGFGCGFWSLVVTNAAEQFGTNLRATVATTVPNFIRGALIPIAFVFGLLKPHLGLLHAAAIIGVLTSVVGLISVAASRETFGTNLDFIES
jgi:putative MFS transporter